MPISFNGTSSKLTWAGDIGTGQYPLTLFAWIKPSSGSGISGGVCGPGNTANGNYENMIFCDGVTIKGFQKTNGGGGTSANATTATQTTWQPAMAVYTSATSRKIYYAAGAVVEDTTSANDGAIGFDRFAIGVRPNGEALWFGGEIAEVAYWPNALTQGNFDSLAAGAAPETIGTGGVCWPLQTTSDLSTTVANKTLTAANISAGGTHPITRSAGSSISAISTYHRMMRAA